MSYADTIRDHATASGFGPGTEAAADRLALSAYADAQRRNKLLTPQTIALNHTAHVESLAAEVRTAATLLEVAFDAGSGDDEHNASVELLEAVRELLAALGEVSR